MKEKLIEKCEENEFDSLSQYLEQVAINSAAQHGISKLTRTDLRLIQRTVQSEFQKEQTPLIDKDLEDILDELQFKLVPPEDEPRYGRKFSRNLVYSNLYILQNFIYQNTNKIS